LLKCVHSSALSLTSRAALVVVFSAMAASWKPSLKLRSFYPPSKPAAQQCEKTPVQIASNSDEQHPAEGVKTGRVWRSGRRYLTPLGTEVDSSDQGLEVSEDEKLESPGSHSYSRDQLLFVKQCMINRYGVGKPAAERFMCVPMQVGDGPPNCRLSKGLALDTTDTQSHSTDKNDADSTSTKMPMVEGAVGSQCLLRASAPEFVPRDILQINDGSPCFKFSKRLSTESVCSTTDTQSDTTDEHDAASSSFESPIMEGGLQSTLRACAPEFVPRDMLWKAAQGTVIVSNPTSSPVVPGQILSSTPAYGAGFSPLRNVLDAKSAHSSSLTSIGPLKSLMDCDSFHGAAH